MSRREKDITIDDPDSRDNGKTYHLREMPSAKGEKWALKVLLLLARSGVDLGPNFNVRSGMAGIAASGVLALPFITFSEIEPLMDEMMGCVTIVPPSGQPRAATLESAAGSDIEEVSTRFLLRREILDLHLGFSAAEFLSKSNSAMRTKMAEEPGLSNIPTSPPPSGP